MRIKLDSRLECISSDSPLHNTLPLLNDVLRNAPANSTVFFYYDNFVGANGNSDCYLYLAPKVQSAPLEPTRKLQPHIDHPPCDEASYDLTELFKCVTQPGEEEALLVTPLDRYLFAEHPHEEFYDRVRTAYVDEWLLLSKEIGAESADYLSPQIAEVNFPVWIYSVEDDGSSLIEIAKNLELGDDAWKLLFELNMDMLDGPNDIPAGTDLQIPAAITGWKQIMLADTSTKSVSEQLYETDAYESLLGQIIAHTKYDDHPYVPTFAAPSTTIPAAVTTRLPSLN